MSYKITVFRCSSKMSKLFYGNNTMSSYSCIKRTSKWNLSSRKNYDYLLLSGKKQVLLQIKKFHFILKIFEKINIRWIINNFRNLFDLTISRKFRIESNSIYFAILCWKSKNHYLPHIFLKAFSHPLSFFSKLYKRLYVSIIVN
jgi:hypothetical protein